MTVSEVEKRLEHWNEEYGRRLQRARDLELHWSNIEVSFALRRVRQYERLLREASNNVTR